MEARRQERQRRDSAKSSAATVLPSSQDQDFHLRLIDLYGQYPCLWNTTLSEHQDTELKRKAWDDITSKLGSHLTASFVRSRISSMRHKLNVYKLQVLEYKMSTSSEKQPEKPFYVDKFAFLDTIINSKEEEQQQMSKSDQLSKELDRKSSQSIASIFKKRLQQQDQHPNIFQHLSVMEHAKEQGSAQSSLDSFSDLNIASVVKKRMQQQSLFTPQKNIQMGLPKFRESFSNARRLIQETRQKKQTVDDESKSKLMKESKSKNLEIDNMLKQRMDRLNHVEQGQDTPIDVLDSVADFRESRLHIPSVVRKRMQQQFPLGTMRGLDLEKSSLKSFPDSISPSTLRALPGDSVSKTKMTKPKPIDLEESKEHSDDDDLYRLHWSVRKQQRTRRSVGMETNQDFHQESLPPLLLGTRSRSGSNMENTSI